MNINNKIYTLSLFKCQPSPVRLRFSQNAMDEIFRMNKNQWINLSDGNFHSISQFVKHKTVVS